MAILVMTMAISVMLIERIREPNKKVCNRRWGYDSPLPSKANQPSDF
jgi:hypothetical protein